jgi:ribonuclease R
MITKDVLESYNMSNVPPHKLNLKVNDICFIMRNLNKKEGLFYDELNTLNIISKNLGVEKFKNGAIKFSSEEFEFVLDEFMFPIAVKKKEHIETHSLIEEFMLLANKSVAKYIYEQDKKVNKRFSSSYPP